MEANQMSNQPNMSAEDYYNRGTVYAFRGDFERAIADYDKAIDLNPNFAKAYNNRGIAYYNCGLIAGAGVLPDLVRVENSFKSVVLDYDKAIELRFGDLKVYFNRSLIRLEKGDWEEAKEDLTHARDGGFDIVQAFFISCGNNERAVIDASAKFRPDIIRMLRGQ